MSRTQYDKSMLNIGTLQFKIPVVQAALSGYSDLAMRRVARLHGAELTFDELVLDHVLVNTKPKRQKIRQRALDDHPVGVCSSAQGSAISSVLLETCLCCLDASMLVST